MSQIKRIVRDDRIWERNAWKLTQFLKESYVSQLQNALGDGTLLKASLWHTYGCSIVEIRRRGFWNFFEPNFGQITVYKKGLEIWITNPGVGKEYRRILEQAVDRFARIHNLLAVAVDLE